MMNFQDCWNWIQFFVRGNIQWYLADENNWQQFEFFLDFLYIFFMQNKNNHVWFPLSVWQQFDSCENFCDMSLVDLVWSHASRWLRRVLCQGCNFFCCFALQDKMVVPQEILYRNRLDDCFPPTNQNFLYLLHWIYSDIGIITMHSRQALSLVWAKVLKLAVPCLHSVGSSRKF